jgi:hypothetical protein
MAKGSVKDYHPEHPEDREYFSGDDLEAIIHAAGGLPDGEVDHQRAAEDGSGLDAVIVLRRIALKERLESAARYWDITRQYENKPTSTQTAEAFKKIEKFLNGTLTVLQLDQHDFGDDILEKLPRALRDGLEDQPQKDAGVLSVPGGLVNGQFTRNLDILQPSSADLLMDDIKGVYRLRDRVRAYNSRISERTQHNKRHEGDPYLNALFQHLALIWMDIFEGELRTSVAAQGSKDEGEAGGPLVRFIRACLEPLLADRTPSDKAIRARICRLGPSLLRSSVEDI